ncbi:ECF transporter S component [Loigolactobacillus zhaoyuanensis]|uniref:ECF transporter S component n=1 Tax=Loigolactobacillus zhaoyuanensis TaxID=2486017 RepID=UPI000F74574B|nr:ECF transporter S component [Loigolactobacillus zhaoyuanensis]
MTNDLRTKKLVYTAILLALLFLLYLTPLGFLQLGPFAITTLHIPVIVGSIILGYKRGAFLGLVFGLLSLYRSTVIMTPTSFVFSPFVPVPGTGHGNVLAIVVSILPRVLVGITPALVFALLRKKNINRSFSYGLAGLVGSLTNTVLVLGLMGLIFGQQLGYHSLSAILVLIGGVIVSNGFVEMIVATLVTVSLASAFDIVEKRLLKPTK